MSKRKTEEQISAEIAALVALKPKVRQRTAFGDDNHAAIDAQLAVLRERMSSDDVYSAYGDEGMDEFDQHTFDAALSACDWMTGMLASDEDSPAASWAGEAVPDWPGQAMSQRRSVTPWFPVAVDPVHEGIYEVEYRQSRFLFRREWRDGVWCIPGAVLLPATRPKSWRGLTAPARTMPKEQR